MAKNFNELRNKMSKESRERSDKLFMEKVKNMPCCKCTVCDNGFYVNVSGDINEWYRKRNSEMGKVVPHICFKCYKEKRNEQISKIAYRIWEEEGRPDGEQIRDGRKIREWHWALAQIELDRLDILEQEDAAIVKAFNNIE